MFSPIIKRGQARLAENEPPAEPIPTPAKPAVRIDRTTEALTEIRVVCACGRSTIVACEHDPKAGAA